MTLNNPCINYLLQISAWNNVGNGSVNTISLILCHTVMKCDEYWCCSVHCTIICKFIRCIGNN